MTSVPDLDQMTPEQPRTLAAQLMSKVDTMGRKIHRDETIIEQLTHEIAIPQTAQVRQTQRADQPGAR
ncbi:hypothetical protein PSCICN_26170 [Pseudomonas cichorii]|uniref:hypothetical protein n=1 Tax=Pseudomonas cichorii TaxID=36746 RepID=UPI0019DA5F07|nr:hypothetical protein PSCICN_26170 [Pseudomonas cichorii]